MAKKTVTSKKRNVRVNAIGQLHVHSSFNNIIVSLANDEGQIISWSSAGKMGFRGSKKNTPYAAQMAAEDCAKVAAIPKNANPIRLHNRCKITGRPKGYMRQFGLSRIQFREMASSGLIPGVKKASW